MGPAFFRNPIAYLKGKMAAYAKPCHNIAKFLLVASLITTSLALAPVKRHCIADISMTSASSFPISTGVVIEGHERGMTVKRLRHLPSIAIAAKTQISTSLHDRVILPATKAFLVSVPVFWTTSLLHCRFGLHIKNAKPMLRRSRSFALSTALISAVFVGVETLVRELRGMRDSPPGPFSCMIGGASAGYTACRNMPLHLIGSGVLGGAFCGFFAGKHLMPAQWAPAQKVVENASIKDQEVEKLQETLDIIKWGLRLLVGVPLSLYTAGKIADLVDAWVTGPNDHDPRMMRF